MEKTFSNLEKIVKESGNFPILMEEVKETINNGINSNSILVITQKSLDFYNIKSLKLKISLPLLTLQNIKYEKNIIHLVFPNHRFQIENLEKNNEIFGAIVHVVRKLLNRQEFSQLLMTKYDLPKHTNFNIGAIISLKERARLKNITIPQNVLLSFNKVIETRDPYLDLTDSSINTELLLIFLQILELCPDIHHVSFKSLEGTDIFAFLNRNSQYIQDLKSIAINSKYTPKLDILLKTLTNPEFSLEGLSLYNCIMPLETYSKLKTLLTLQKITSLSLRSCINDEQTMIHLFNTVLAPEQIQQNLMLLDLSYTKNIIVPLLCQKMRSLFYLDLSYCDLDLDDVFKEITIAKMINLKTLKLTGNKANSFDLTNIKLPRTLTRIFCDKITWDENSLIYLLKVFSNRGDFKLQLSLDDISMTSTQWNSLFAYFSHLSIPGLVELSWNNNPIKSQFYSFLQKTKIKRISLNNSFTKFPDYYFFNFLKNSNIKELSIQNDKNPYLLCSEFGRFVDLIIHSNVTKLDLTNNFLENRGVNTLLNFKNMQMKWIKIDNCNVTRGDILQEVLRSCPFVVVPYTDIQHFPILKRKILRKSPKIAETYNHKYPIPRKSIYLQDFSIDVKRNDDKLPKYFSREEIHDLKQRTPAIDEKSIPAREILTAQSVMIINHNKLNLPQQAQTPRQIGERSLRQTEEKEKPKTPQAKSLDPRAIMKNQDRLSFAPSVKYLKNYYNNNDDIISYKLNPKEDAEIEIIKRKLNQTQSIAPPLDESSSTMDVVFNAMSPRRSNLKSDKASVRFEEGLTNKKVVKKKSDKIKETTKLIL